MAVIALALACNEELAVAVEGRSARARELSSQGWTVAMALCASSRNRRDLGGVGVNSAITVVGWGYQCDYSVGSRYLVGNAIEKSTFSRHTCHCGHVESAAGGQRSQ